MCPSKLKENHNSHSVQYTLNLLWPMVYIMPDSFESEAQILFRVGILPDTMFEKSESAVTIWTCAVRITTPGVSLEAGYQWSTAAYVASHRRLLNLTSKRVVVVIYQVQKRAETTMSLCTPYFNSQLYCHLLITYGRLLKNLMKPLQHTDSLCDKTAVQNHLAPGSFTTPLLNTV